jgi:hypothetical protein
MEQHINIKPLGKKSYGSIPHLPGSRVGPGDYHISEGQARIATVKKRDKHDLIIVQEKLDGANVGVAKIRGEIVALTRAGYLASQSNFIQHQYFDKWVEENKGRFDNLLIEGERVCGEWLAMAHGTRYNLPHEPFVPFDIINGNYRSTYLSFIDRVEKQAFTAPKLISIGEPLSISEALKAIEISGHGAIDEVEGAVWRVERHGKVEFLCKFVKHSKTDGKYLDAVTGEGCVWNFDINKYK